MSATTRLVVTALAALSVSSCTVTVDDIPLPRPGVDGPSYHVRAVFDDALNLPERARVKIGGTDVGVVTGIETTNFLADVELEIRGDIALPEGTRAELRQPTPLGDIHVAVILPEHRPGAPMLTEGDVIDRAHTSAGASAEELMTALSMLLDGGAMNQVARIASELNAIVGGRGPQLAHLLTELTATLTALNQRTGQIDAVLHGLDGLTATLSAGKAELGRVADTFPALIAVIAENNRAIGDLTTQVSTVTAALGDFSTTTGPEFLSLFDSVQRLMTGFTAMGDDLATTLDTLNAIGPAARASMRGSSLAVAARISYLDIGAFTDVAGSRLPDGTDVTAFIGSLSQVLARVLGRVQGGHR
ncbi:MCE family protein [Nocardia rhizosphaerae]|uniref:MCE family protein n=1 Tax=Nocardia rhizosphaerae TaxID=1691571 RepID=A0ABV8LAI7_9NOCA